jgi:tetratricopeptide (TPR) repeat protein
MHFKEIENLIDYAKFSEAQDEIRRSKKHNFGDTDLLTLEILECWILVVKDRGKYREQVEFLKAFERVKGNFKTTLGVGTLIQQVQALFNVFNGLYYSRSDRDNHNEIHSYISQSKEIMDLLEIKNLDVISKKYVGRLFYIIGRCLRVIIIDYELAMEYFQKSVHLLENIDVIYHFESKRQIMDLYKMQGNMEKADDFYQNALGYLKILPNYEKGLLLNSLAIYNSFKGETNHSINYYKQGIEIAKNSGFEMLQLMIETNMWEEFAENRGNVQESLNNFKRHLEFRKSKLHYFGNQGEVIWNLFTLIKYGFNHFSESTLNNYLKEIREFNEKYEKPNPINDQYIRLAHGIVLNKSERMLKKVQAQQLFREIVDEPVIWFDLTFTAMQWLGRSLLIELQITSSDEIFDELSNLIFRMKDLAEQQKIFWILPEVFILKAKLELLKFDFKEFERNLAQAELIATEKGLTGYLLSIKNERKLFEEQFKDWEKLLKENASYYERIKQANLVEYIRDAKKII